MSYAVRCATIDNGRYGTANTTALQRTMTDYIVFPAIFLLAIFLGFRIGRWWAVALVLLVPLAFPLYGPDSDGAPRWFYPTLFLGPPVILALSLGVIGCKLRHRRHVP